MSTKNQRSLVGANKVEVSPVTPLLQVMDEVSASAAEHKLN